MSNFLNGKNIQKSTTDITKSSENFLKEFLKYFYRKIINTNDFYTFENNLNEWIKNINKNARIILELMQNHNKSDLWFSSIIGFFYQYGIGCDVDKDKALELYLFAINNEKSLIKKFTNLRLLKENDNEFNMLQNINIIIGKYLLSLFYYKDIILERSLNNNLSDFVIKTLKSAKKGDPIAQNNLGYCYQHGQGVMQDYKKAFEWYYKSANYGCAQGQNNLGECYYYGMGTTQDCNKAFEWYYKSANNGCAEGQSNLGYCYLYGQGVAQSYNKAFKWYAKSANNGYVLGRDNLRIYDFIRKTELE